MLTYQVSEPQMVQKLPFFHSFHPLEVVVGRDHLKTQLSHHSRPAHVGTNSVWQFVMLWLQRKTHKQEYLQLLSDARKNGWEAKYTTIKFGALGHYNSIAPVELATNSKSIPLPKWRKILLRAAAIAISCSQVIFLARNISFWPLNRPRLTMHSPCNPNGLPHGSLFYHLWIIVTYITFAPLTT